MEEQNLPYFSAISAQQGATSLRRPGKQGFTLLELVIASALLVLLLSILLQFSTTGYRITHEEFERSAAESNILILSNRFARDLEITSSAGLSLSTEGRSVAMHPVTLTDTGAVVYEDRFLGWHHDSGAATVGRFQSTGVTGVPFNGESIRLEEATLTGLASSSDFALTQISSNIASFSLENPVGVAAPLIGSPLKLKITVNLKKAKTRKVITFERSYQLRTSGL